MAIQASSDEPGVGPGIPGLRVEGLSFGYRQRPLFDDLSFELHPRSICALLGPNGAGKSTLIRVLGGLLRPARGRLLLAGSDPAEGSVAFRSRIGVLPEQGALLDQLSLEEHIQAFGPILGMTPAQRQSRSEYLMAVLGLGSFRHERLGACSLGTRKKAGLLLALMHDPELLLLDEPFENLDGPSVAGLHRLLAEFAGRDGTLLFSTHQMGFAWHFATHVLLLQSGHPARFGSRQLIEECVEDPQVPWDGSDSMGGAPWVGGPGCSSR